MIRTAIVSAFVCVLLLSSPAAVPAAQPAESPPAALGVFIPLGGGLSGEVRSLDAPDSAGGVRRLPAGVIRSRRVALDFRLLEERVRAFSAARGAAERRSADPPLSLVFNFFNDAAPVFRVAVVEPAVLGDGYVLSGTGPDGLGSLVLVVHTDPGGRVAAVSASASTPGGAFRVAAVGGGSYLVEELDRSVPWVDADPPPETAPADPVPSPLPDSGGEFSASADSSAVSQIDVLVLYTDAAAAQAGGAAAMRAEVERLFGETNTAFRNSGVPATVAGWARPVSYTESLDLSTDLERLQGRSDGYLEAAHSLRAELGADLVHLIVAFTPVKDTDGTFTCGLAYRSRRASSGFGVTLFYPGCRYTFTHEVGHNLGLAHDRYMQFGQGSSTAADLPYAYGYSNAENFSPASGGQCWSTVMAYYKHCFDVPGGRGFYTKVLTFSTPYRRHSSSGEPLGVLGDYETYRVDGPADAARALERTRATVAGYYRRPDPEPAASVDLSVPAGGVSVSPVVVDVGDSVSVRGRVSNVGGTFVSSSRVHFWSRYDNSDAEWVHRGSRTLGGLSSGSSRSLVWRGTGGTVPGNEFWAVCVQTDNDVDEDNDCRLAADTVVIRDPDAVDGGEFVAESSGTLGVGADAEVEFAVDDVTGERLQIQPHWFLLSYEPVDKNVWGAVYKWQCREEDYSDCWNADGTENAAADWDWRYRAGGVGSDGSFLALLGLEGYSWSDGDRWRFTFRQSTWVGEEPDARLTWRLGILRVSQDDLAPGDVAGSASAAGDSPGVGILRIPRGLQDAFRPVPRIPLPPASHRLR